MRERFIINQPPPTGFPGDFARAWAGLSGETVDRNRLRHVERVVWHDETLYVKFFHRPRLADLVRNLLTPPRVLSQGQREFAMATRLQAYGIPTIAPLAFGDRCAFFIEKKSIFISREQPGPTLGEVIRRDSTAVKDLLPRFINLFQRLLEGGFYLPDISLEHILVAPTGDLVLLDLHNGKILPQLSAKKIARMLGRLWAGARGSITPRFALRIAKQCLAQPPARGNLRPLIIEAAARGDRWEKRERRKRNEEKNR